MSLQAAYILPHPPLAVPEIGRGQEGAIEATLTGFREVARRIAHAQPDTILFISPHTAFYGDWIFITPGEEITGDFSMYHVPRVTFSLTLDQKLREHLVREAQAEGIAAGYAQRPREQLDHGVMVPLAYIDREYPHNRYEAVLIGGSGLPRQTLLAFGRCMARVMAQSDKKCVLVVSGDLSHKGAEDGPYGFDPAAPVFDDLFGDIVTSGNYMGFAEIDPALSEAAAECGLSGFIMLAGVLNEIEKVAAFSSDLLSLEGPFGVGYGVAAFERKA